MSLILDALNRAERERKKSQAIPDLQTVHEPVAFGTAEPRANKHRWLYILGALGLGFIVMIYWLQQSQRAAEQPIKEQLTIEQPDTEYSASVGAVSHPLSVRKMEQEVTIAPVKEISPGPSESSAQNPGTPASIEEFSGSSQKQELTDLYAAARAEESAVQDPVGDLYIAPPVESESSQMRATTVASPTVTARNYDSLIEIPDIGDLPWGFRQQIPTLNYVRHNFNEGGVTSVVINGRAHNAGAVLSPDLVLEEIYIDGVIFSFKQTRFKLRALNSWINM